MVYPDCMIDLETMSTRPNAAIVAIGAVGFNFATLEIGPKFYTVIDLRSAQDVGLHVDGDTVLWWLQQNDAARSQLTRSHRQDLSLALTEFRMWLHSECAPQASVRPWGNGAAFDIVICEQAFRACGIEIPWRYSNQCCYRTIKTLYPNVEPDARGGTHHNALDDALFQAEHLLKIRRTLKGNKK